MTGMALDVLEQQRRAFFTANQIGNGGGFKIGIDLGRDALEFAHSLDFLQPDFEVAGIGGARPGWHGCRLLRQLILLAGRRYLHAHVHGRASLIAKPLRTSAVKPLEPKA
jgi:hypothetical protein